MLPTAELPKIPLSEVDMSLLQTKSTTKTSKTQTHPAAAMNKYQPPQGDVNMEIIRPEVEKSIKNNTTSGSSAAGGPSSVATEQVVHQVQTVQPPKSTPAQTLNGTMNRAAVATTKAQPLTQLAPATGLAVSGASLTSITNSNDVRLNMLPSLVSIIKHPFPVVLLHRQLHQTKPIHPILVQAIMLKLCQGWHPALLQIPTELLTL